MKIKGCIYCFTFNNGKTYIGQTVRSVKNREYQHLYDAKTNKGHAFHRALRKYGNEYTLEILKEVTADKRELLDTKLNKYETFYIKQFNSLYCQNGYNLETGGGKGKKRAVVHDIEWYKTNKATIKQFQLACEVYEWNFDDYLQLDKQYRNGRVEYQFLRKDELQQRKIKKMCSGLETLTNEEFLLMHGIEKTKENIIIIAKKFN